MSNKTEMTTRVAVPFEPRDFEHLSIVDRLASALLNKILSGELESGERIVEMRLAKQVGVGQGTVREALIQLEHRGFVTRVAGHGTFVIRLTDAEIGSIIQVRLPLELLAVKLAKKNLTPNHVESLSKALDAMKTAADRNSVGDYSRADLAFHETVWALTGNPFVLSTLRTLCTRLFAVGLARSKPVGQPELRSYVEQHRVLVESLIREDVVTCQDVMTEHIKYFWPLVDNDEK